MLPSSVWALPHYSEIVGKDASVYRHAGAIFMQWCAKIKLPERITKISVDKKTRRKDMGVILVFIMILFIGAFMVGAVIGVGKGISENGQRTDTAARMDADIYGPAVHTSGLPVAAGVKVNLYATKEKLVVDKEGQKILLNAQRIKSIDIVTGKDIKGAMSGAAAGALIFGMAGAAVGALTSSSKYMVVMYEDKSGEITYITLDVTADPAFARKLKKYYCSEETPEQIEL